jgi:hypothetical protein
MQPYLSEENDMRKLSATLLAGLAVSLFYVGSGVWADDDRDQFRARLIGFEEPPSISSTGRGRFSARIRGEDRIDWELSYEQLEGAVTTQAHVHFGQKDVNGGISFFLCGGGGRPACTPTSGNFNGTAMADDVIGPTGQGIAPTEIAELIRAMRAGMTYANVHTDKHPGGEIRGQIRGNRDDD